MLPRTEIFITSSVFEEWRQIKNKVDAICLLSFSCNVSHADIFHPHLMMCTNMTTILSHQEDLGPSMLDVKYEGLGGTGLVTTPLTVESWNCPTGSWGKEEVCHPPPHPHPADLCSVACIPSTQVDGLRRNPDSPLSAILSGNYYNSLTIYCSLYEHLHLPIIVHAHILQ